MSSNIKTLVHLIPPKRERERNSKGNWKDGKRNCQGGREGGGGGTNGGQKGLTHLIRKIIFPCDHKPLEWGDLFWEEVGTIEESGGIINYDAIELLIFR